MLQDTAVDDVVVLKPLQVTDLLLQRHQLLDQFLVLGAPRVVCRSLPRLVMALVQAMILWVLCNPVAQKLRDVSVRSRLPLKHLLLTAHADLGCRVLLLVEVARVLRVVIGRAAGVAVARLEPTHHPWLVRRHAVIDVLIALGTLIADVLHNLLQVLGVLLASVLRVLYLQL